MDNIGKRFTMADIIKKTRLSMEEKHTQEQMAELLGLESRQSYANIENGNVNIEFKHIDRLCEIFDCDIGYLRGEYPTKRHEAADVQEVTGLSEKAIENLIKFKESREGTSPIVQTDGEVHVIADYSRHTQVINELLESEDTYSILSYIALYRFSHLQSITPRDYSTGHKMFISGDTLDAVYLLNIQNSLGALKRDKNESRSAKNLPEYIPVPIYDDGDDEEEPELVDHISK